MMSYSVIKADLKKNKNDILSLWEKNEPGILPALFEWKYAKNPAGAAQVWLARDDRTSEYVGVTALFRRRFTVAGNSFAGGITGDFLVDKAHRSAGVALMLQKQVLKSVQDGTVDLLYGFPNKASEPIVKRIGYHLLGERTRLVSVLKTATYLSKLPGGRYWGSWLGPPVDIVRKAFLGQKWKCRENHIVSEEIHDFDERLSFLWQEARLFGEVFGERSVEYLRWKFMHSPARENKILAVFDPNNQRAKGFIVYRHFGRSLEIRDFVIDSDPQSISVLMADFITYANAIRAVSIEMALLKNIQVEMMLRKFGFIARKDTHQIYIFYSKRVEMYFPAIKESESWLLLQSDDDL